MPIAVATSIAVILKQVGLVLGFRLRTALKRRFQC